VAEMLGPYEIGKVHHADCLEAMRLLPDGCVQSCVTSPPYWGLRKYDVPETVWGEWRTVKDGRGGLLWVGREVPR
jgi:DNA modification methylase